MKQFLNLSVPQVPLSQASLALGVIGLGQAWTMYFPTVGLWLRPVCAVTGFLLLLPVLLRYLTSFSRFITEIRHPLSGSLMAPISMALLILCDYLATVVPKLAYPFWFVSIGLHITLLCFFFWFQFRSFHIANIVPSWFLYPVGLISSSLAGSQFGHTVFSATLAMTCITIYFFMLPLVLYRLVFAGMLPRRAKPTLAIMAAPINLTVAAYMVNFSSPDPILTGALAGIAMTMTLLIYLCYIPLMRIKFQPSIAATTFPSVISAIATHHLTEWFRTDYPQWYWLRSFGLLELMIATVMVCWVSWNYFRMYQKGAQPA